MIYKKKIIIIILLLHTTVLLNYCTNIEAETECSKNMLLIIVNKFKKI